MKTAVYLVFVYISLFLITGCASSGKLLQKGEYDAAIDKSVKKLMKNPDNPKEEKTLEKAWKLANEEDEDEINKLELLGQPEVWEDIFNAYTRLDNRQKKLERLPDEVLRRMGFEKRNYSVRITGALKKAAGYHYNQAVTLLETGDKTDARKAYDHLMFIKDHLRNYKNTDSLTDRALQLGTNHVLFLIDNQSETVLPKNYEEQMLKISLSQLNEQWLQFDTYPQKDVDYDYEIYLLIKEIQVSPDQLTREKIEESRKVEDGWEYVLDENGNVKKDTAGNDIKKPKYITAKAYVTLVHMQKSAVVKAVLDYYDNRSGQLIKNYPLQSVFSFEHHYATFEGDKRALSKRTLELSKNSALPFPSDEEIIFDTSGDLKQKAYDLIKKDRPLFRN